MGDRSPLSPASQSETAVKQTSVRITEVFTRSTVISLGEK